MFIVKEDIKVCVLGYLIEEIETESERLLSVWNNYPSLFCPQDLALILDQIVQLQDGALFKACLESQTSKQLFAGMTADQRKHDVLEQILLRPTAHNDSHPQDRAGTPSKPARNTLLKDKATLNILGQAPYLLKRR